jgi:hypothetical protein
MVVGYHLQKQRIIIDLPPELVRAVDTYRRQRLPVLSRNLFLTQMIVEGLKTIGIVVPPEQTQEADA